MLGGCCCFSEIFNGVSVADSFCCYNDVQFSGLLEFGTGLRSSFVIFASAAGTGVLGVFWAIAHLEPMRSRTSWAFDQTTTVFGHMPEAVAVVATDSLVDVRSDFECLVSQEKTLGDFTVGRIF